MDNKYNVVDDYKYDFMKEYEKKNKRNSERTLDFPPNDNLTFTENCRGVRDELKFSCVEKQPADYSFNDRVKNYVQTYNPTLYILTPCYGGLCHLRYMICLIATITLFERFCIPLKIEFCGNDSLVTRARNNLLAKAMSNTVTSHVIFIDCDIIWEPSDILKLLISEKQVIGGIYPLKKYQWEKMEDQFVQSMKMRKDKSILKTVISTEDMIRCNMVNYNVNYLDKTLHIRENLAKVKHIASGFMMIQREVIESMYTAYPSTKYVDDVGYLKGDENNYAYALFDCGVEEGHYFSEDWFFCHRWSKLNGDVYMDITINLSHIGPEEFKGSYISSLV